ncbi:uncharacterized protein LOC123264731 [Cotesia glomerata]|nr:uncharacterized protein LOC123264731 [Cotesia glomerata]XP_044584107.1 uncharacterized protein LOC123264731 [Cotesia glomerata]
METLKQSIQLDKKLKVRKSLSIVDGPESNGAKKRRITISEKQDVNLKKKKINQATKDVFSREDGAFVNYVKPRSISNKTVDKRIIEHSDNEDGDGEDNHDADERSNSTQNVDEGSRILENLENLRARQEGQADQSNAGTSRRIDENNLDGHGEYELLEITLPVVDADLDTIYASSPIIPEEEEEEDNSAISLNDDQNEDPNDAENGLTENGSTSNNQPFDQLFSNLWPETNNSNVDQENPTVTVSITQLKQCFKEFGKHFMGNMLQIQKDTKNNEEEFEIPPVVNNKIKIFGIDLDAEQLYKAKDVKTMRHCVNNVLRAFWPLETRKRLVLSDRAGKPANRITIQQDEIEKIKKICKLLQKGRNFDKKNPDNCIENIRSWIDAVLKNDRRPLLTEEQKKVRNEKAKQWREQQKLPPTEGGTNVSGRKRQQKSSKSNKQDQKTV